MCLPHRTISKDKFLKVSRDFHMHPKERVHGKEERQVGRTKRLDRDFNESEEQPSGYERLRRKSKAIILHLTYIGTVDPLYCTATTSHLLR